ncbi:MAG: aminotransferase class V-fold PLP-dependent enzyme [Clostridia bacterium]
MVYLDNAATSFPKPRVVIDAVYNFMTQCGASPGRGGYDEAIRSSEIVYDCRFAIADLFSIPSPDRIFFTKNSTEAINTAIFGLLNPGDEIIISSMEHNAVMRSAFHASKRGAVLKIAQADSLGRVSPESVQRLITKKTKLICIIHSSNVSGTINDIYKIQKIASRYRIYALFDCAQSAGVIPIDASGLDMIAFSGHKGLLGPMGTGGLYVREGINLNPLLYGGTGSYSESPYMPASFPDRFEAGTMNASGIAGLLEGVKFIKREGVFEKEKEITEYLYDSLSSVDGIIIPGERVRTSAISIVVPSFDSVSLAEELNSSYSIAVRAGLHCAPMAHRTLSTSHTGTVRFSPGFFTEKSDVDYAVNSLKKIIGK